MRVRNAVPPLLLVLVLGLLAGFAWLSRHPEDPRVIAAEEWPVIGPVVARVRAAYLPSAEETRSGLGDSDRPTEILVRTVPAPPEEPGVPAKTQAAESVWVAPETPLRRAPRLDAPVLDTITDYTEIPVLERLPAPPLADDERPAFWLEVWHRGHTAWIRYVEPPPGEPVLGRKPEPVLPLESLEPDPERLTLALDLLGSRRASGRLGPYVLYTDVTDPYLLQRLSAVAEQLEPIYRQRYDLELVGEPAEAVVLFSREDDYRSFQQAWERLAGLPAAGHAGRGLVAFFVEGRQYNETVSTLVHELAHLLNRRALGPALPPWLDEGLAEDLTWAEIDPTGRLRPGTWGGDLVALERDGVIVGDLLTAGLAIRRRLPLVHDSLERDLVPSPHALLTLDWKEFVGPRREVHYLQAGLLIRFLLDERDLAPRFRRFLADTAEGRPLRPERFRETLELSWSEISERWTAWVGNEAQLAPIRR